MNAYRHYRKYNIHYESPRKQFFAAKLKINATPEEEKLWKRLKSRQLGVTFVTQKPVLGYIPDFYCRKYQLAIEVDGHGHDPDKDWRRTKHLNEVGVFVIRFTNEDVNDRIEYVIDQIKKTLVKSVELYEAKAKRKRPKYAFPRLG